MKSIRVRISIASIALAGMLLAGGCHKQNPPADNSATASSTAAQPTVPAPPPDQPPSPDQPAAGAPAPGSTPGAAPGATVPVPASAQAPLTIPAGTHIAVAIQQALGSKISQAGESFTARVAAPIMIDGVTVVHAGAPATGTVVDAKPLGRFKGGAYLELRLDTVRADGTTYQIRSNALERVEKGKGKRTARFAGGGAGLGAILGGIAGGGKGVLVGGLVGGGAGAAGAGLTGKHDILIPAETTLTFRLRNAVQVSQ